MKNRNEAVEGRQELDIEFLFFESDESGNLRHAVVRHRNAEFCFGWSKERQFVCLASSKLGSEGRGGMQPRAPRPVFLEMRRVAGEKFATETKRRKELARKLAEAEAAAAAAKEPILFDDDKPTGQARSSVETKSPAEDETIAHGKNCKPPYFNRPPRRRPQEAYRQTALLTA